MRTRLFFRSITGFAPIVTVMPRPGVRSSLISFHRPTPLPLLPGIPFPVGCKKGYYRKMTGISDVMPRMTVDSQCNKFHEQFHRDSPELLS
jgi:hypothetical protein